MQDMLLIFGFYAVNRWVTVGFLYGAWRVIYGEKGE